MLSQVILVPAGTRTRFLGGLEDSLRVQRTWLARGWTTADTSRAGLCIHRLLTAEGYITDWTFESRAVWVCIGRVDRSETRWSGVRRWMSHWYKSLIYSSGSCLRYWATHKHKGYYCSSPIPHESGQWDERTYITKIIIIILVLAHV